MNEHMVFATHKRWVAIDTYVSGSPAYRYSFNDDNKIYIYKWQNNSWVQVRTL